MDGKGGRGRERHKLKESVFGERGCDRCRLKLACQVIVFLKSKSKSLLKRLTWSLRYLVVERKAVLFHAAWHNSNVSHDRNGQPTIWILDEVILFHAAWHNIRSTHDLDFQSERGQRGPRGESAPRIARLSSRNADRTRRSLSRNLGDIRPEAKTQDLQPRV